MTSELWERLRAARKFADKRQQDIADALGVSRPTVALWESHDTKHRTSPSLTQLKLISKATRVPLAWLLDDTADPGRVFDLLLSAKSAAQSPESGAPSQQQKLREAFLRAMEFYFLDARLDIADSFDRVVPCRGGQIKADLLFKKQLVSFSFDGDRPWQSIAGDMLVCEKMVKLGALDKHVILIQVKTAQGAPGNDDCYDLCGIKPHYVHTPEEAAREVISICA